MPGEITQKSIKYHPDFDDPSDNLVFVSNDGIYFRASSHKLAKISTEAGTNATAHSSSADKPIELDFQAEVVAAFLRLTYKPRESLNGWYRSDEGQYRYAQSLLSMVDYFDCPILSREAGVGLVGASHKLGNTFDALLIASDRNDTSMANLAIAYIQRHELAVVCQSVETLEKQLSRLPAAWANHIREKVLITIDDELLFRRGSGRLGEPWRDFRFKFPSLEPRVGSKRKRSLSPTLSPGW